MLFYVSRDGVDQGAFEEDSFRIQIATGEILPDDWFWAEGMEEWQPVSWWRPAPVGPPTVDVQKHVPPVDLAKAKQKKMAADYSGVGLALLAVPLPLVSAPLFFVSLAMLFAAFVLAIVSIVKGRLIYGILLLVVLPIALIGVFTFTLNRDEMLDPAKRQRLIERGGR